MIEVKPSSNSEPAFPDGDDEGTDADPVMIEIKENAKGPIDDPVTAEDSNDPGGPVALQYWRA